MLAANSDAVDLFRRLGNGTVERSEPGLVEMRVELPAVTDGRDTPLRTALREAAAGNVAAKPPRTTP